MTDSGLTDLLAMHSWITYSPRSHSKCLCGWVGEDPDYPGVGHPAHVALVVEQHTGPIIAELYEQRDSAIEAGLAAIDRAEKAEATNVRVENALEAAEKSVPDDWGVTYIYTSRLRAALEGEQQ